MCVNLIRPGLESPQAVVLKILIQLLYPTYNTIQIFNNFVFFKRNFNFITALYHTFFKIAYPFIKLTAFENINRKNRNNGKTEIKCSVNNKKVRKERKNTGKQTDK